MALGCRGGREGVKQLRGVETIDRVDSEGGRSRFPIKKQTQASEEQNQPSLESDLPFTYLSCRES